MSQDKTRQEARQEMYKYNSRSPCWKEKFRRRCLERLKDSRGRHLLSKRPLDSLHERHMAACDVKVQQRLDYDDDDDDDELDEKTARTSIRERIPEIDIIMREEFDRLKGEVSLSEKSRGPKVTGGSQGKSHFCDIANLKGVSSATTENNCKEEYSTSSVKNKGHYCSHSDDDDNNCLDVNALSSWYEEIYDILRAELEEARKKEEELHSQSLQEAGDEHLKHEEEELCSAIQALCTEEVICPLCEKFNLIEQKNLILCKCGLNIDVEQDCITLKYVKETLLAGTEEHSQKCNSKPIFSLHQKFGISTLLMSCRDCDFLFVIV